MDRGALHPGDRDCGRGSECRARITGGEHFQAETRLREKAIRVGARSHMKTPDRAAGFSCAAVFVSGRALEKSLLEPVLETHGILELELRLEPEFLLAPLVCVLGISRSTLRAR